MYANMSVEQKFKEFVVADARSYSDETFLKAVKIISDIKKGVVVGQEEFEQFARLVEDLQVMSKGKMENEVSGSDTINMYFRNCSKMPLMSSLIH